MGKAVAGKKKCSRCRIAEYCSRECQRLHWKQHKIECEGITQPKGTVRDDAIGPEDSVSNVGQLCGHQELDAFSNRHATSPDEIDNLLMELLQKHSDKDDRWVCIEADYRNLA